MPLGLYIQDIGKAHIVRGAILLNVTDNTTALVWYDLSNPQGFDGKLAQPFITRGGGTDLNTVSIEGTLNAPTTVTIYTSSRTDGMPTNALITAYPSLDSTVGAPKLITIDRPFRWIAAAVSTISLGDTIDGVYVYCVLPK